MDLNEIVMQALKNIQEEGFIEKTVETVLRKTLEQTIDNTLRTCGEFGKQLEKEVKSKLQINLEGLDIAGYNVMVLNTVRDELDKALHVQGVQKIREHLQELLGDSNREYKLSELIEEMKSAVHEDERATEISFHINPDRRILTHIYFDEQPDLQDYNCKYRLCVREDGTVTSVEIKGERFDNKVIMGGLYGLSQTLFRLYSGSGKLIVDEDAVNIYYPDLDE